MRLIVATFVVMLVAAALRVAGLLVDGIALTMLSIGASTVGIFLVFALFLLKPRGREP